VQINVGSLQTSLVIGVVIKRRQLWPKMLVQLRRNAYQGDRFRWDILGQLCEYLIEKRHEVRVLRRVAPITRDDGNINEGQVQMLDIQKRRTSGASS